VGGERREMGKFSKDSVLSNNFSLETGFNVFFLRNLGQNAVFFVSKKKRHYCIISIYYRQTKVVRKKKRKKLHSLAVVEASYGELIH
jgi:hypothetical protein